MVTIELDSGERIRVRPIEPEDGTLIADAFRTASQETRLHRFFTPIRELPRSELKRMSTIDPAREKCVVGEVTAPAGDRIVCGARYVRLANPASFPGSKSTRFPDPQDAKGSSRIFGSSH